LIRAPPVCWNVSRSEAQSPNRIERSNTGSDVSLTRIGFRASAVPRVLRPIIPVE